MGYACIYDTSDVVGVNLVSKVLVHGAQGCWEEAGGRGLAAPVVDLCRQEEEEAAHRQTGEWNGDLGRCELLSTL